MPLLPRPCRGEAGRRACLGVCLGELRSCIHLDEAAALGKTLESILFFQPGEEQQQQAGPCS